MKVPFDMKYRPFIESGKYKLETRDGCLVEVLKWDKKGSDPIVGIQHDGEYEYGRNWRADGHLYPHGNCPQDLMVVRELNEYEKVLRDVLMIPLSCDKIEDDVERMSLSEDYVATYGDIVLEEARKLVYKEQSECVKRKK